ncbi:MAG TPA: hypothetical protein VNS22_20965 [Geminicoccus sp.]|uniref:hypothetical protein n=1 Tax=Geminicoccus sp. TaxID=2024832 RepID=UPI002BE7FF24|nr:hypothetical protein [Geminicoccus sp.]HWL70826.1 hypothetical protein [Geminicoccus sp.]
MPLAYALLVLPVLAACSTQPEPAVVEPADRIIAEDAARAAAIQPLENTYPSVREVPPRPKLSYSAAQRRQIQEGLVADRAHAKQTAELVRTTEGASPPPMPPVPEVMPAEEPRPAPRTTQPRAPAKVRLIERRDTSGDLSSFLDDVMAVGPEVDQIEPSLVPSPRSLPANRLTTTDPADAGGVDGSLSAGIAGFFGDGTVAVTGTEEAPAGAPAPLEAGRRWLFPLDAGQLAPNRAAVEPMLAELVGTGALTGRRVAVTGRSADAELAAQRAQAMADLLRRQGVPSDRIEQAQDTAGQSEAVDVRVLGIAAPGTAPGG